MSTLPLPAAYRLTYADWLRLPEDSGRLHEIINGEIFVTPSPGTRYQRIQRRLGTPFDLFLRGTGAGELFYAPTGVRLSDEDVVEPDLLVILAEHRDRLGEQAIQGAPDLVVEILSPGSARRDLVAKRELNARNGVPEYWVVDGEARNVEVLTLQGAGYARAGFYRHGDVLHSALLPELEIDMSEVFAEA